MTTTSPPPSNPIHALTHNHSLLHRLHIQSTQQEYLLDQQVYTIIQQQHPSKFDTIMRTQFVALDQDKCQFVYQIARMLKATQIVEAGCSFGMSTIYLALIIQATLRASPVGDMEGGVGGGGGGARVVKGICRNTVQSSLSLDDESPEGCTIVIKGFHKT